MITVGHGQGHDHDDVYVYDYDHHRSLQLGMARPSWKGVSFRDGTGLPRDYGQARQASGKTLTWEPWEGSALLAACR